MKFKYLLVSAIVIISFVFSVFLSHYTYHSDFAVFYHAANIILDPNIPNISVYEIDTSNRYLLPEALGENHVFVYSMAVAYIMAPIALMSYYMAKSTMIFINIWLYLFAIIITLRIAGVTEGRWFGYPLALLCLLPPFIQNLRQGQVNAILLFLIAVGVFAAIKNRPHLSGFFLAFAAFFKIFPIAVAMVLGIKNWRIFVSCIIFFIASFLVPGSFKWIQALSKLYPAYNPVYLWLKQPGLGYFVVYVVVISGFTARVAYKSKDSDYPILAALAIPAVFLVMPIVEYNHLTLLSFSYAYLLAFFKTANRFLLLAIIISLVLIGTPFFIMSTHLKVLSLVGLIVLWVGLAGYLSVTPSMRMKAA